MNTPSRRPVPTASPSTSRQPRWPGEPSWPATQRRWLKLKSLANLLRVSSDTVERRAIPWQQTPVPHRLRYKWLRLDPTAELERRYYLPDAIRFLQEPPSRSTPRRFSPRFV